MSEDDHDFQEARWALEQEDFALARDLLYPRANDGDAKAQYLLALACRGVIVDPYFQSEMLRWYEEAASRGHTRAAFDLACLLDPNIEEGADTGPLATKDREKAQYFYRQAVRGFLDRAQRGDAESQSMLGVMYLTGVGVSADVAHAIHWFSESYRNGYMLAANNLCSIFYSKTDPTDHDRALARYWYERSKAAGCQCIQIPEFD